MANVVVVITIDEGAELNCIDEEFCLKCRIEFIKTDETATAAGQHKMSLSGQTRGDLILFPTENKKVQWNLGKCVVVKNLGNSILLGEPGKKDNSRTGQIMCYVAWNPYRVHRLHNTCFMLPQMFYVVGT